MLPSDAELDRRREYHERGAFTRHAVESQARGHHLAMMALFPDDYPEFLPEVLPDDSDDAIAEPDGG